MSREAVGRAKMRTAEEAKVQLADPCLQIILGMAEPVFPQSTRGSPSATVMIVRVRPGGEGWRPPVGVDWNQWRLGMVPVLEDDRWRIDNAWLKVALQTGRQDWVLGLIGDALKESFEGEGWL